MYKMSSTPTQNSSSWCLPVTKGNEVNTYTIKVNRNMVHDLDDRVVAFNDDSTTEWVITFRRHERAYTIERKDESCLAWTAPNLGPEKPHPLQILLQPLSIVGPPSYPIPAKINPVQLIQI
ncbi:hypothetical protein F5J12DRAFT_785379 [Pisolithus orientalis]|uniref:uncharacterized protein n=1 Tax=Pisolithus orientalis TaxID=936130 RepID=UPI002224B74B|nr:uncharacterized protein F5J12DRAFT_785379 [Pisolithus orientalis]KAI5996594.1 hypothetical protein F5J12DRAFT_785379 [Pisolithus orientalis]